MGSSRKWGWEGGPGSHVACPPQATSLERPVIQCPTSPRVTPEVPWPSTDRPTHTLPSSHAQHSGGEGESPSKAPPPVGFFYWGHSLPVFSAVALQPQISFNVKSSLGPKGFPGGSGKTPTCQGRRHSRRGFNLWVRKISRSRKWHPTPVFLPGKSHGQRSLVGSSSRGCKRVGHTWAA